MHTLANILAAANSWTAVIGLLLAGAAMLGLIVQQELPHEYRSRLARIGAAAAVLFGLFALLRGYWGDTGWMTLNLVDAYLWALVAIAIGLLGWRDGDEVYDTEPLDDETDTEPAAVAEPVFFDQGVSNHRPTGRRPMVIDSSAE